MKKICIIGAGLCGGYLANELLNFKNFEINIIDIDSINNNFKQKKELKNIYLNSHNEIIFNDHILKGYGFGGTSNYWHGGLTEFEEFDLKKIDFLLKKNFSKSLKKYYNINWEKFIPDNISKIDINYENLYSIFKKSKFFNLKKYFIQVIALNTRSLLFNSASRIPAFVLKDTFLFPNSFINKYATHLLPFPHAEISPPSEL